MPDIGGGVQPPGPGGRGGRLRGPEPLIDLATARGGRELQGISDVRLAIGTEALEVPADAAALAAALIRRHPAAGSGRALEGVVPALGPKRQASAASDSAQMIAEGALALLAAGALDGPSIDGLIHGALSNDAVSKLLRETWLYGRQPPPADPISPREGPLDLLGNPLGLDLRLRRGVARACVNGLSKALARMGAESQSAREAQEWTLTHPILPGPGQITALLPAKGCAGDTVHIQGVGFGPEGPLVKVAFTSDYGYSLLVPREDVTWSDTELVVRVPQGVGDGPVGTLRFPAGAPPSGDVVGAALDVQGAMSECFGAMGQMWGQKLATVGPLWGQGLPKIALQADGRNRFVGGRPRILSFTADVTDLAPGGRIGLSWQVERADTLQIVPVRTASGQRHQLPAVVAAQGSGSLDVGPVPGEWEWEGAYELRASNTCNPNEPETARVVVRMRVPRPAFLWGVATAGAQYEGGLNDDWALFVSRQTSNEHIVWAAEQAQPPEHIAPVEVAGEAVRHSDLYVFGQDLQRARLLGATAYRLSLEWSRIQPKAGAGSFDLAAITAFYAPMIRMIRAAGMEPVVTLQHLTLPQWVLNPPNTKSFTAYVGLLEDDAYRTSLGGWSKPATVDAYVTYVKWAVARLKDTLGDDVPRIWITLNEPVGSIVGGGYLAGIWPPGFTIDGWKAKDAYLNVLRAHVRAYDAVRALVADARISIAHAMLIGLPLSAGDQDATDQSDYFYNWHFLDAAVRGIVDMSFEHDPAKRNDKKNSQEFFGIAAAAWTPKLDFVGVNYYRAWRLFADSGIQVAAAAGYSGGHPKTHLDADKETLHQNDLGWLVKPDGLLTILRRIRDAYGLPVMITENGAGDANDRMRPSYTTTHADIVRRAKAEGVDVFGYLHWSLTDNWEWHLGYRASARFGLFRVDRTQLAGNTKTLPRRPTESALTFAFLAAGGSTVEAVARFGGYSDDGSALTTPTKSAGRLWSGAADDGRPIALFAMRLGVGGAPVAWLREGANGRWVRLHELRLDAAGFGAARPGGGGLGERELSGSWSPGGGLVGVVREAPGGSGVGFELTIDPLVGTWAGTPVSPIIVNPFDAWEPATPSSPPPAPLAGRVGRCVRPLPPGVPIGREWCEIDVERGQASAVTFRFVEFPNLGATELRGTLNADWTITGTEIVKGLLHVSTPGGWSATRLPDDIL